MMIFRIKIRFWFFSLVILNFLFSCQSKLVNENVKFRHDEEQRQNQAKEILNNYYSKSSAARFENDPELPTYMEEYLEKKGPQLASKDVVKTLLETSHSNHYDPIFLMAVIKTESQFRPRIVGDA